MLILPKKNAWRKGVLLYRSVLRRKGYGVHSPFVYNLITKVIEERCPYYCFSDIERLRKRLRFEAVRPKQGALLFRLTHHFRPQNILQIGASTGLSTLYLTSYRQGVGCIVLEKRPEQASIARRLYAEAARTPIDLRVGDYTALLPGVLKEMERVDFVFFNTCREASVCTLFDACAAHAQAESVFVFDGIKANRTMRTLWKRVCGHPDVSVTLDLYSLGIVCFNKKWHKRNYTVYF
jgi:predicted O-methyltransferase YrrM